jgi:hypothetical protein
MHALAQEVLAQLIQKVRNESQPDEKFWCFQDGKPEWMQTLARNAHMENMGPNDESYQFIVDALESIAAGDDDTDDDDLSYLSNEIDPDIYDGEVLAWLASNRARVGYCDEFLEFKDTTKAKDLDFLDLVRGGQVLEKQEVFHAVLASLQAEASNREEASEQATTN